MSSDFFLPPQQSVLDLPIDGSIGSFSVKARDGSNTSVRVQYMQTHIGFAVNGDAEERLLQQLAPVREVFNVTELGFDELMQRDIDDSRVSTELIPYLLEDDGGALVKLFPPIIVVVLPTDSQGRPASRYPVVEELSIQDEKHPNVKWTIVRSGQVGSEVFEFKQMDIPNRGLDSHNYAQLRLNTTGCKLAIVDGQHRAMALLALYRNWKQWPENTLQYRDYYKRWARGVIEDFDLSGIRLPIMLCTFPDLHAGSSEIGMKVTEACRSVFLALNKNARPVTRARNYLLDDDDLIAHFLRTVLGHIKQQDASSQHALRLWNIELDGEGDRRALSTPMALSGVMHLYSLIEFLMLNSKWEGQLKVPRQNLWKKKDLTDCLRRLDAKSLLGTERGDRANRSLIERETAAILCNQFWELYGELLVKILDRFHPYRVHATCSLELEAKLRAEAYGSTYHAILFEGQGIGRVFDDYVDRLREERDEIKDSVGSVPPALEASFSEFEGKSRGLQKFIDEFYCERTGKFFKNLSKARIPEVDPALRDVYRNTLTTEAFQLALVITFFAAAERCRDEAERNNETLNQQSIEECLDEYVSQLNRFFEPESEKESWAIFRTFYGDVRGGHTTPAEVIRSSTCLRKILVPGELKPDEWPKFRYLLLELWKPSHPIFMQYVDEQRQHLRLTAVGIFEDRELDHEAKSLGVRITDLDENTAKRISSTAKNVFCKALKPLGVEISASELSDDQVIKNAPEEFEEEETNDDDGEN